jgi:iron-sulfur cluster repair protein YtfE (RIC family)
LGPTSQEVAHAEQLEQFTVVRADVDETICTKRPILLDEVLVLLRKQRIEALRGRQTVPAKVGRLHAIDHETILAVVAQHLVNMRIDARHHATREERVRITGNGREGAARAGNFVVDEHGGAEKNRYPRIPLAHCV